MVGLTWTILSRTKISILLKLTFEYPLYVSFEAADTLTITLADPDLFLSSDGIQILEKNRVITRELMS